MSIRIHTVKTKRKTKKTPINQLLRLVFVCLLILGTFRVFSPLVIPEQFAISPITHRTRHEEEALLFVALHKDKVIHDAKTSHHAYASSDTIIRTNLTKTTTLALLYPPGMIGGYRNQVMRFVALVRHAVQNHIPQLLLPSIYFTTTYERDTRDRIFYPIAMEDVFDVDHWNTFPDELLPRLVRSIPDGDCWTNRDDQQRIGDDFFNATIEQFSNALDVQPRIEDTPQMVLDLAYRSIFVTPLANLSLAITTGRAILKRPRKVGLTPKMLNCSHPLVYGGGKGGSGVLWNDYVNEMKNEVNSTVVQSVLQALRPAKRWRDIAEECLDNHGDAKAKTKNNHNNKAPYFALHTRVELEMMNHPCSHRIGMEMNLTKIFPMVDAMIAEYNHNESLSKDNVVGRVFLAVSRQGMEEARGRNNTKKELLANENLDTLEARTGNTDTARIVECGEGWMKHWYSTQDKMQDNYYGTLIPMVLNFYIATEATVFIGVSGSSWSTDVWTTRFYQGKGDRNYQYTSDGIIAVPNGGLPPPHGNC